ncbi:MAG: type II secretion system protein [Limnothrix sp. RL_2_0]|nr:type II secretion system protein [Limnothrix sp. RL_2_0]
MKKSIKRTKYSAEFQEQGFSLVEAIGALLILTITFAIAGPLFLTQTKSNIKNEIRTGAVSVSQQILDDLRLENNLTLGETSEDNIESLGKFYNYTQFICTDQPTFNNDSSVTCPITVDVNNPIRYILLQVKYYEETIYTVETIYTDIK